MNEQAPGMNLTPFEWRLVRSLREMPESPVKTATLARIETLLEAAQSPCCPEAQADGVPCGDVHAQCEHCGKAVRMVEEAARL